MVGVLSRGLGKKFLLFVVGCWLLVVGCWLFAEIPCGIALWAVLYQSSIIEKFFSRVGIAHHNIYRCSQKQYQQSPDGLQLQYSEKTRSSIQLVLTTPASY